MEILSKLTPAESHLISNKNAARFKDLLKYTMMDLLLKSILELEVRDDEEEGEEAKFIKIGSEFNSYTPLTHELPFLEPFQKAPELEVLFSHLIKMAYENARNKSHYIFRSLAESDIVYGCIKSGFFNRTFCNVALTSDGKLVKKEIDFALDDLEHHLPDMIRQKPEDATKVIRAIGGNIFLIKDFDYELLKEFDTELHRELTQYYGFDDDFVIYFAMFDTMFDDFDSVFDGFGSDGGGWDFGGDGGGGDAGCGGGCGGCGGCGG